MSSSKSKTANPDVSSAKQIFTGSSFLTHADLLSSINFSLTDKVEEEILYTPLQLKEAKRKNMMLVSMVPGISMRTIVDQTENKLAEDHNLLNPDFNYTNKEMYSFTKTCLGAYLVSHLPLSGSQGLDYFEETVLLSEFLSKNVHLSVSKPTVEKHVEDFKKIQNEIYKMFHKYNPQLAIQKLNESMINRLYREKGCELLLRTVALHKAIPMFRNDYVCVADKSFNVGQVMKIGGFVSKGANILAVNPKEKSHYAYSKTGLYVKIK